MPGNVKAFNVFDPSNPLVMDTYKLFRPIGVFIRGDYVYVADRDAGFYMLGFPFTAFIIEEIIEEIQESGIARGVKNSLIKKLEAAIKSLDKGNVGAAINKLKAFQNQVRAQKGKKIPAELADKLIADVDAIIQDLEERL